jgi:hypothetical protein
MNINHNMTMTTRSGDQTKSPDCCIASKCRKFSFVKMKTLKVLYCIKEMEMTYPEQLPIFQDPNKLCNIIKGIELGSIHPAPSKANAKWTSCSFLFGTLI